MLRTVWVGAFVATFVDERLLIRPHKVPMPREEVALSRISLSMMYGPTSRTVKCMDLVCWIWVTTKSSYLLFAPAAIAAGVFAGFFPKHKTASM